MVAVMYEAARTLLASPRLPAAPLVLLFDGGEESVCQVRGRAVALRLCGRAAPPGGTRRR